MCGGGGGGALMCASVGGSYVCRVGGGVLCV